MKSMKHNGTKNDTIKLPCMELPNLLIFSKAYSLGVCTGTTTLFNSKSGSIWWLSLTALKSEASLTAIFTKSLSVDDETCKAFLNLSFKSKDHELWSVI